MNAGQLLETDLVAIGLFVVALGVHFRARWADRRRVAVNAWLSRRGGDR